jgi:pimeloyl-ACP methyl ester carboxylesterase
MQFDYISFYRQGAGPHPTILLLHGFPGFEKNHDLAQTFRRAGYNVMVFHYRGSWGSEGDYSISNVLEDAEAAVNFLQSGKCVYYRVDPENIIIMGHSLGGFTAFMTAVNHPEIKSVAFLAGFNYGVHGEKLKNSNASLEVLSESRANSMPPLKGITPVQITKEIIENRKKWNLMDKIEKLKDHSVLMIAGSRDDVAGIEEHHNVLAKEFRKYNTKNFREVILDANHDFSDKRISLAKEILYWLDKK